MSEEFIKLFDSIGKKPSEVDKELQNCVGKVYKYVHKNADNEEIIFYIHVEYYEGFDRIGVNHHNNFGESIFDEWDVEHFYEIIKDSVEIDSAE